LSPFTTIVCSLVLALPIGAQTISAELLAYPVPPRASYMMQQALQMSGNGDHTGAIVELKKTLEKFPNTGAYVHSLLGVEYLKTDQIPEAVNALEQAVLLLPHDASNHANLGLAFVCNKQYARAEPELQRALDLDPHNTVAKRLLAALDSAQVITARK
jgi:Tfp pilus assembly protein PilF